MAEAVFDDTQLAEYLSDVGIEDWGIDETPANITETPQLGLRDLHLSENSKHTQEAKFRSLLRSSLLTQLPHREVSEFLEQFRYQIVSSNLLEERPIYASTSRSTAERRLDLLFSIKGPWDMLKIPSKYWVGGGGCVVLIVSLFSLKLESSPSGRFEKLSLIGTLLIALYLFAHSRRRILRLLHRKALGQICLFAQQQKLFDGDCVRALKSIQQSDQIHPSGARKIRSMLCSSLHLLTEQYCDAIKDCLCMCSELDLQRYWEVYDLTTAQQSLRFVMNDDFIGFEKDNNQFVESGSASATSCCIPLATLKQMFKKVHFLRRAFLCCLLTADSTGKCSTNELEGWTVITDHLKQCTELATQLSNILTKERIDPRFKEPAGNFGDKSFISLSIVSQHIASRMDILTNTHLSDEEYKEHMDQMRMDLSSLNSLWAKRTGSIIHSSNSSVAPSTPDTLVTESCTFTDFSTQDISMNSSASSLKPTRDLTINEPFESDQFMNELTRALSHRPRFESRGSLKPDHTALS